MKNIAILGSTGSIGRNSLEVLKQYPEKFRVLSLAAYSNARLLLRQIEEFHPAVAVLIDENAAGRIRSSVPAGTTLLAGQDALVDAVSHDDVDVVISAFVGFAGLQPTITAIKSGKDIALANKEILVVAGEIVTQLAREHDVRLMPVDSEHSAILQCLTGEARKAVRRLILTASGGPFVGKSREELAHVTIKDALNHPNWSMGNKITIDSATLMNKGLEIIEAHWLFDIPPADIDVVVHPQSIIHSMVEFVDGSVKAQLGVPDMKLPILYALTWPERFTSSFPRLDFSMPRDLTFREPDLETFRCLSLAREALEQGGTVPAALNAANEIAVEAFLSGTITFLDIPELIGECMQQHQNHQQPGIEDIFAADEESRQVAQQLIERNRRVTMTV